MRNSCYSASKYHNRKTTHDGQTFDSQKEARRWAELRLLEKAGEITQLSRQTVFELVPNQIENGKVVERKVTYKADFTYLENGHYVCEDVKSEATKTPVYRLKKKLMRYVHGIEIKEV